MINCWFLYVVFEKSREILTRRSSFARSGDEISIGDDTFVTDIGSTFCEGIADTA